MYKHLACEMTSAALLLLVGVAAPRHLSYYDNGGSLRPMMGGVQEQRICTELCMAGMGGEPCGGGCLDVIPRGLPELPQSGGGGHAEDYTRRSACPLLCRYRLGFPLCGCNYTQETTPFFRVNFVNICKHFCDQYSYQIYGCESCDVYRNITEEEGAMIGISGQMFRKDNYDWNSWCVQMCQAGEGGSACYCDILPLAANVG